MPRQRIVFAGPTLPAKPDADWRRLLAGCDVRPPARRGDVLAALADDPHTLVILDGYYYTVPAVTHKEILYALNAGVRVIGAASMGALRAAELAPCGMLGAGRVFRWYRDGVIEGDDEVAILHGDAEEGYRPLTLALVEVRHALALLAGRGELPAADAEGLLDDLRRTPFSDRHPERVARRCDELLGAAARAALERELAKAGLKRDDAREALELAQTPYRRRPPGDLLPTLFLNADREWHLRPAGGRPTLLRIWNVFQLLHPETPAFVRRVRLRWVLATAARRAGLEPEERRVRELAAALRGRQEDGCRLAVPEVLEEARSLAAAELAGERLGGVGGACAALAARFGLPPADAERLPEILTAAPESMPAWWLCRAFVFSPAFAAACRAAELAAEVHGCFTVWARGGRLRQTDLSALAAELWGCESAAVGREATRRGLRASSGPEPSWRDALEWLCPAERLPRAINAYPEARQALRALGLAPPEI